MRSVAITMLVAGMLASGCDTYEPGVPVEEPGAMAPDGGGMVWLDMELTEPATYEAPQLMYAHSGEELFEIDPKTLEVRPVGQFGPNAPHMTDLAVTPDGRMYALSNSNLYEVSPADASVTWLASVPGTINVALTFDIDGTLLASDKSGKLRRIDPLSGAVSEIGTYGPGLGSSGDLVAIKDGTLYGVSDVDTAKGNNTLLTVDPVSGKAQVVGSTGFRMLWGLSFWGGTLYGFTRLGEFVAIDPSTARSTLIHQFSHEFWGAAVSPKAPMVIE